MYRPAPSRYAGLPTPCHYLVLLLPRFCFGAYHQPGRKFDLREPTVDWLSVEYLQQLIATYGYWAVGVIVALESMGIPLPGETVLVLAALYAGGHHDLNIWGIIASAAIGAILGDNVGYLLGRELGYRLLRRYGRYVGLTDTRIKLGQYLFLRHGGKVVFFGRFIAVLRVLAAFLAGANRMDWRLFSRRQRCRRHPLGPVVRIGCFYVREAALAIDRAPGHRNAGRWCSHDCHRGAFVRSHEAELEAKAERALPGPLQPERRTRDRSPN